MRMVPNMLFEYLLIKIRIQLEEREIWLHKKCNTMQENSWKCYKLIQKMYMNLYGLLSTHNMSFVLSCIDHETLITRYSSIFTWLTLEQCALFILYIWNCMSNQLFSLYSLNHFLFLQWFILSKNDLLSHNFFFT